MNRLAVRLLTAVALASCGPPGGPVAPDAGRSDRTVFGRTAAFDHLPASTLAVVAVRDAGFLAALTGESAITWFLPAATAGTDGATGSDGATPGGPTADATTGATTRAATDETGETGDTGAAGETGETGASTGAAGTDGSWAGIDPDQPMGVAVLDLESGTTASFAALADPAALHAALRARPGTEITEVDGTHIYTAAGEGIGFVVRADYLFVVRSHAASKRAWAEVALAAREPDRGLVGDPGFRAALSRLAVGRDAVAYVAADRIGEDIAELYQQRIEAAQAAADQAAKAVREARDAGAPADQLAALQNDAAVAAVTRDEMNRSAGVRVQAARELLASWGRVAAGIAGDGPVVDVGLSIRPRPDSPVAELLSAPSPRIVERLATLLGQVAPVRWMRVDRRYALTAGAADLAVAISGSTLVMASDADALGSIAGRAEGAAAAVEVDAHLWLELFGAPSPASLAPPAPPELPDFGNEDVPPSEEYEALLAAWKAAVRRIGELAGQRAGLARERRRAVAAPLGTLSLTVTAASGHLTGRGREVLEAEDLASALARARAAGRDFDRRRTGLDGELQATLARLDELGEQLLRVRVRDVEAWDRR